VGPRRTDIHVLTALSRHPCRSAHSTSPAFSLHPSRDLRCLGSCVRRSRSRSTATATTKGAPHGRTAKRGWHALRAMIVPTLRVGMPFRTLCVPRLTRSVSHCVTTRSVGTIKPIKAADRLCCMRSALAPARSGAERRLCVRHKSRLWQAERRRCVGGCAAWMPRKPPFGRVPPEQCRSRGNPDEGGAGQGAGTLGYLGLSSNSPKAKPFWR
jgi:hypothetical protein